MNFSLPPLTVEPLVENAIRHGLKAKGGGVVTLSTTYENRTIRITIADNGVGFDPESLEYKASPKKGERSHIGLLNVRRRIQIMAKGQLIIDSKPGRGTIMTILLPEPDPRKKETEE